MSSDDHTPPPAKIEVKQVDKHINVITSISFRVSGLHAILSGALSETSCLGDLISIDHTLKCGIIYVHHEDETQRGLVVGAACNYTQGQPLSTGYNLCAWAASVCGTIFKRSPGSVKIPISSTSVLDSYRVVLQIPFTLFDLPALQRVKADDAFTVHVEACSHGTSMRNSMITSISIRETLCKTMKKAPAGDTTFVTFAQRQPSGCLRLSREFVMDASLIQQECPKMHHRCITVGADPNNIFRACCTMAFEEPHKTAYLDEDSDFEDVEEVVDQSESLPRISSIGLDDMDAMDEGESDDESFSNDRPEVRHQDDTEPKTESVAIPTPSTAGTSPPLPTRFVVTGAASASWEALLSYLSTGIIDFAPLRSSGEDLRDAVLRRHTTIYSALPRLASPKSIYRLAREFELEELQKLCLNDINKQLTTDNVLPELFSVFTSKHNEAMELEMKFLRKHWSDIKGSARFADIMTDVVKGVYPHAAGVLAEIMSCTTVTPSTDAEDVSTLTKPAAKKTKDGTKKSVQGVAASTGGTVAQSAKPTDTVDTSATSTRVNAPSSSNSTRKSGDLDG